MEPTLRQLEYLVAVADAGTFVAAADAVKVSQPALSAQVAEAEQRLGVTVFERSRHGATPTPEGVALIASARRVLDSVRELMRLAAERDGDIVGDLSIGVIPTVAPYLLPSVVQEVRRRYPAAEIVLREERTAELVDSIHRGDLDFGILAAPVPELDGRLTVASLGIDPFVLAVPAVIDQTTATADDLPMLLLEEGHCLREHAAAACSTTGFERFAKVQGTGLPSLCQMVAANMGSTMLPASAIEVEARAGAGLKVCRLGDPAPTREIVMAWRPAAARVRHYEVLAAAFVPPVAAACVIPDDVPWSFDGVG